VPEKPFWTFRESVGGLIACLVIGAICWSALYERSAAAETALVGAAGSVAAWLFRGSGQPPNGNTNGNGNANGNANGNGYTNGSAGSAGSGGGGTTTPGA